MRRSGLATRIAALCVAIVVLTVILAAAFTAGFVRNEGTGAARDNLAHLADVAQSLVTRTPRTHTTETRIKALFVGLDVRSGVISETGTVAADAPIVRRALTPTEIIQVLGGQSLSIQRAVAGDVTFIEARPTPDGGVVLVQRRADALAPNSRAIRGALIALVVAAAIATVLGLLVAWRMVRPLRRTAAAAHEMAAGERDIEVPAQGPREVVEVAEAMTTLATALRTSENRQRDFLMSVSHDLRTPLTAIRGYAESLADGAVDPSETARVGRTMSAEAIRMNMLVGDLLDLARLDADDFQVSLASVDLAVLAAGAVEVYQTRCVSAGVRLSSDLPGLPVVVTTDAQRVRQVLDGLFDNALRVTPAGEQIVVALRSESDRAVVQVRDSGPGLSDDDLQVAFARGVLYERYRGERPVGTGLGLAIVHGLVTRLGGSVEAGHAPEGGACFTVQLPLSG